jgi:prevent-host-death family protein
MRAKWQLQEAKNRFSEMVSKALSDGPQTVTRHGEDAVVVLSVKEFKKMNSQKEGSLLEFFQKSPLFGVELNLDRNKDSGRKISL